MLTTRFLRAMLAAVTLVVVSAARPAQASPLAIGGCVGAGTVSCPGSVTNFGTDPGFFPTTVLANTGVEAFTAGGGAFSGTVDEIVARDSVSSNLDFIFQVHNDANSAHAIGRVTTNSFDSFTTDVGYSSTVFITAIGSGTGVPGTIDRLVADFVGFDFAGGLLAGQTSDLLVIKTNASTFVAGNLNFLAGDFSAQARGFAPVSPVPEPASLLFVATGLVGVASRFRRGRSTSPTPQ